mmetsp:Transcript_73748/g.148606  ORF Transcript_73748/g.148606 Transcript_73748/m.148606 type:complete len:451 (-) Transcript_73748:227-1579(-)
MSDINDVAKDLDIFWLLFGSTLVFFMQAGFCMLEVGCVPETQSFNILIKNILDCCLCAIAWGICGHALAYGDSSNGVTGGTTGYAMFAGDGEADQYAAWLFNWAFVIVAVTIVSGAVGERIYFHTQICFVLLFAMFVYPYVAHWTWSSDGFLSARKDKDLLFGCGVLDYSGSGVINVTGGLCALLAIKLLGPREHVIFVDGVKKAPPGQSASFQTLGTLSIWFGWFGLNGGSVGYLVGSVSVATRAMFTTAIGGAFGGMAAAILSVFGDYALGRGEIHQLSVTAAHGGILSGLVATSASAATCNVGGAIAISAVGASLYHVSALQLEKYEIDDITHAVPTHLIPGVWGILAAGLFTVPELYGEAYANTGGMDRKDDCAGLFFGSASQLGAQIVWLLVVIPWVLVTCGVFFYVADMKNELRVPSNSKPQKRDSCGITAGPLIRNGRPSVTN